MKPSDFRNMTFDEIQHRITGMRRKVYEAWLQHGPGTTRRIALRSEMSLLTFRPRTTELVEAGLVELDKENQGDGHEGRYRAITIAEWQRRKKAQPPVHEQALMKF